MTAWALVAISCPSYAAQVDLGEAGVKRVLIVEDYDALADIESRVCEMEGYSVRVAHSVVDAVMAFNEFAPHVVLLDLGLSDDVDGTEFLQRLRGSGDSATKVLVVSGRVDPQLESQLQVFGNVELLMKPFKPLDLAMRLHSLLEADARTS